MHTLATSYYCVGRREEALKLREQVLQLCQKVHSPGHPATLAAMQNLAISYDAVGRRDEARDLREQVLALGKETYLPESPDLLDAEYYLAISYEEAGRREEALKLRDHVLQRRRQLLGAQHPDTLSAQTALANSYGSFDRESEALSVLRQACETAPTDANAQLTLAAWQAWLGLDSDFDQTRLRALQLAAATESDTSAADDAVWTCCLRPSTDNALLSSALKLGRRGVALGNTHSLLPYHQLALGLALYRNSQYAEAQQVLTPVQNTLRHEPALVGPARLFCAMSLFSQHKTEEARNLFRLAAADMPPLPQNERQPQAAGTILDGRMLIWWLAYKEARALIDPHALPAPK
jgi:tetratricopeptide (TPR) repeat protein